MAGVGLKCLGNLNGQLTRGGENQGLRDAPGNIDPAQDGQCECRCFARARLGLTQKVAASQ